MQTGTHTIKIYEERPSDKKRKIDRQPTDNKPEIKTDRQSISHLNRL